MTSIKSRRETEPDEDRFSQREIAIIKKRYADSIDPTRYVIVSPILPKWCLFYCPSDGVYLHNHLSPTCLFKRKAEALAVAKLLNGKDRAKGVQVIAVRKTKTGGFRIMESVTDPDNKNKTWKPVLQR